MRCDGQRHSTFLPGFLRKKTRIVRIPIFSGRGQHSNDENQQQQQHQQQQRIHTHLVIFCANSLPSRKGKQRTHRKKKIQNISATKYVSVVPRKSGELSELTGISLHDCEGDNPPSVMSQRHEFCKINRSNILYKQSCLACVHVGL